MCKYWLHSCKVVLRVCCDQLLILQFDCSSGITLMEVTVFSPTIYVLTRNLIEILNARRILFMKFGTFAGTVLHNETK